MDKQKVELMSPLVWAYVGDSVYELFIRNYLVDTTTSKPNDLHKKAIKYVKASSQSEILKKLEEDLTSEEKEIIRRTRNTQNHHLPKNASLKDYMYATAIEGLIGYLYLTKQEERLDYILNRCIEIKE